jgi:hypothetical protein
MFGQIIDLLLLSIEKRSYLLIPMPFFEVGTDKSLADF